MIRHYDRGVQLKPLLVIVQTMLKNNVASLIRKRISDELAEGYEDSMVRFLIMRQLPPVFVFISEIQGVSISKLSAIQVASLGCSQ